MAKRATAGPRTKRQPAAPNNLDHDKISSSNLISNRDLVTHGEAIPSTEMAVRYLRIERLTRELRDLVEEDSSFDVGLRRDLGSIQRRILLAIAANGEALAALPSKAPELWVNRSDHDETPIAFIKRVYAKWLRKREQIINQQILACTLTLKQLRRYDQTLYVTYAKFCSAHPETENGIYLATTSQTNDLKLSFEGNSLEDLQESARKASRVASAIHRRVKRGTPAP
ncbi:MAG: hypothetical protein P4M05_21080 [Bradyrhizobium sp.]|nr:hypothetical protein [Bradyrhizobium sp.]